MNHQDSEATEKVHDESGEELLDFDAWADLSARLLQRDRDMRLSILEECDIGLDAWNTCDQHWNLYLAAEIAAGRMDQARAYGMKCAQELERRSAERTAAPVTAAAAAGTPDTFSETAPAIEMPLPAHKANPLPFQSTPSPEFLAGLSAPRTAASHDPAGGLTAPLGTHLLAELKDTLPFGKQRAQPPPAAMSWPRLTLQQYASLCAELSVTPQNKTEILHKYHITADTERQAVDREWQDRLAAHADTRAEWQRLYSEFRDWLLRRPK